MHCRRDESIMTAMRINRFLAWRSIAISLLILGLVLAKDAAVFAGQARSLLPTDELLAGVPKTVSITDRHGEVLYYLFDQQNRLVVDSQSIAKPMKEAIIAAEDERFYGHQGVDIPAIGRAIKENWRQQSVVSGGSTITMQLVKNLTGRNERDWQRKIREAYQATVIEQRYTKDEILTAYLNVVPLGHNLAGVETASRFYFDKPAALLTLAEAATLAALPTAPEFYAANPDALERRRNYVLRRMTESHKIKPAELEAAMNAKTPIRPPLIPLKAPHFTMAVVEQLKNQYGTALMTSGWTVKTTLDLPTQILAEKTINEHKSNLQRVRASNVALVASDPQTGDVLAMVGSADFNDKDNKGEVNFALAPLSYGSTLKPLIYTFLMEKGPWSPGAIMWDVKTKFSLGGRESYTPQNYDRSYFGPMTIRQALANSRNVTAIKALLMVSLPDTLKRLEQLGISSLGTDASRYGPSLAVGGGGIPLLEMVGAYGALANEGQYRPIRLVKEINGEAMTPADIMANKAETLIKPAVAYEIADILQDNNARSRVFGRQSQLVISQRRVAAKTGTAEDYRSALTIGYTPQVVVGVIVANNNNEPLAAGAGGAMAAAPFFNRFISEYLADKPAVWYERPSEIKDVQFKTVIGPVGDLATDWQSPSDRFARPVAEIDNPLWQAAVTASRTVAKDEAKADEKKPNNNGRSDRH